MRIDVETLNLDAASYRQLAESHTGPDGVLDTDALRAQVLDIIAQAAGRRTVVAATHSERLAAIADHVVRLA